MVSQRRRVETRTRNIDTNNPIELQLWKLADLLLPVTEVTNIVFTDQQLAVDELRLRVKAARLELESLRREKALLMTTLNGKR